MGLDNCNAWVERDKKVIAKCQHLSYFPLVVAKGKGSTITDEDGNEYLDFLSSASSINLGSSHPVVTEAIKKQLDNCTQYTAAYSYNRPMIEYAERLVSIYPGYGKVKAKVAFGNCGSDANDAAVKFARAYTKRSKIITFINGYHGNTYGSSTLSTCTTRMHKGMGPFLPEVYHFPFYGNDVSDLICEKHCLAEMERAFKTYLPPEEVAAVIIEPIQGDGGLLPAHPIFMLMLHDLCKKHGILFISEEVQQAFFRTGRGAWFGIENYLDHNGLSIVPDGIIMGKSLGAGLTLGAFMAREEIMDSLPAPAHLFTLGGNSIACAAGIAAFDYMNSHEFREHMSELMSEMDRVLKNIEEQYPDVVGFTRGIGISRGIGICFKGGFTSKRNPDPDGAFKILWRCYEKGLIIISVADNILRVQPPLVLTIEELKKAEQILLSAMDDYVNGRIPDEVLEHRQGW